MATVFRGKLDGSEAVRTHYYPLAGFYLGTALRSAESSLAKEDPNDVLREVIISVTFSAMALEAWANEIAEYVFKEGRLQDFIWLNGEFKRTERCSAVLFKHKILMAAKNHPALNKEVMAGIEDTIKTRNSLVHYKMSESAGKSHHRSPSKTETDDPMKIWSVSFLERPISLEPSLIERLSPSVAVRNYNTVYDFFGYWHELEGIKNGMENFRRLPA